MRFLILLLALPIAARDIRVIHLEPFESAEVVRLDQMREQLHNEEAAFDRHIRLKYLTEPGKAEAGEVSVEARSIRPGWELGFEASQDGAVIVPKIKVEGCGAGESQ